jgi:hypothetical protein
VTRWVCLPGHYGFLPNELADTHCTATNTGENIIADIIATRPPAEVVEPTGRNSFAIPPHHAQDTEKGLSTAITSASDDSEHPSPTQEEKATLRKVPGNLNMIAYALCLVEFAERASYYGSQTLFSNFVEFGLPKGKPKTKKDS